MSGSVDSLREKLSFERDGGRWAGWKEMGAGGGLGGRTVVGM